MRLTQVGTERGNRDLEELRILCIRRMQAKGEQVIGEDEKKEGDARCVCCTEQKYESATFHCTEDPTATNAFRARMCSCHVPKVFGTLLVLDRDNCRMSWIGGIPLSFLHHRQPRGRVLFLGRPLEPFLLSILLGTYIPRFRATRSCPWHQPGIIHRSSPLLPELESAYNP